MTTVRWLPQAEADLEAIRKYYLRVAPDYASPFIEGALEQTKQLKSSPLMGRMVPEIEDKSIRELIYRQYRIVYFVDVNNEQVDILTIFHSARQFGSSHK